MRLRGQTPFSQDATEGTGPWFAWRKSSGGWPCSQSAGGGDDRRMRRVVIVAFDDAQSLDISGPAEAFSIATRFFKGDYAIELVTPDGQPARCTSGLSLNADRSIDAVRGAIDTLVIAGGVGDRRRGRRRARDRMGPRCRDARAPRRVGLHRRVRARRGGAARRPPRDHALGRLRQARRALPADRGRVRPDLRARRQRLDLGRRHRRDGPRARPDRRGPRPRGRAEDRPRAGAVRPAPRRAVAVQRPAHRRPRAPRAAARRAGAHRRAPRAPTCPCPHSPPART